MTFLERQNLFSIIRSQRYCIIKSTDTWQSMTTMYDDCNTCFHLITWWNMIPVSTFCLNILVMHQQDVNLSLFYNLFLPNSRNFEISSNCSSGHWIYFFAKAFADLLKWIAKEKKNAWSPGHYRILFINLCCPSHLRTRLHRRSDGSKFANKNKVNASKRHILLCQLCTGEQFKIEAHTQRDVHVSEALNVVSNFIAQRSVLKSKKYRISS